MAGTTPVKSEVILALLTEVQKDQSEMTGSIKSLAEAFHIFQRQYAADSATAAGQRDAAHKRLDNLEPRIEDLEKVVQPLIFANKIMSWIAATLGVSVIALIWSIVTRQVVIAFP